MNDHTRNALEVLKTETLKVLYEQHVNGRQYLRIKEVRERLGIPPSPGRHPNDMVCHFLLHLQEERLAAHTYTDQWRITEKGVSLIEGRQTAV